MSWIGLAPRVRQSGEKLRSGAITKEGSPRLRWALVQAAWVAVRCDEHLSLEVPQDSEETRRRESHGAPSPGKSSWPCSRMLTRREPYRFSSRDFVDRKLKRLERRIRIGGSPAEPAGATPL